MRVVMILVVIGVLPVGNGLKAVGEAAKRIHLNAGYYLGGPQKRSIQEGTSKSMMFLITVGWRQHVMASL